MDDKTTHISFSGYSIGPHADTLFVGLLAGALIIHAYNRRFQRNPTSITVEWSQWALCSRRLYRAALWAAVAMIVPMIWQLLMVISTQSNSIEFNSIGFGSITMIIVAFISTVSLIVSIAIALYAVSWLLPQFSLGDPISLDKLGDDDPGPTN